MRRRGGFPLLEAVVALAITAVVLVVLQRATGDAVRARTMLAHRVEEGGALRAGLVHLVREVGTAEAGTLPSNPTPPGARFTQNGTGNIASSIRCWRTSVSWRVDGHVQNARLPYVWLKATLPTPGEVKGVRVIKARYARRGLNG